MNITLANASQKQEIKDLWQHCFCDKEEYVDLWFDTIFKPENTVVATDNGVIGALQFVFYDVVVGDDIKKAAYMCGVGVKKELRGQDIGTKMIEYTYSLLKEKGIDFIFLYSEADEFYIKLGFSPVVSKQKFEFTPKESDMVYSISSNLDDALFVYKKYCEKFNNYLIRTPEEFEYIHTHYPFYKGALKVLYFNNKPVSYIVYSRDNDKITVDEVAFIDEIGMELILDYIYSSGCKNACLITGENDGFEKLLSNPKKERTAFIKPVSDTFNIDSLKGNSFLSTL